MHSNPPRSPIAIPFHWILPLPGLLKVDTDGFAMRNPGSSSCGGVFCNCCGFVKGYFSQSLEQEFSFQTKIMVIFIVVDYTTSFSWRKYVVQLFLTRSSTIHWKVKAGWLFCLYRLASMEVVFSHIFRKGNQVGDRLATNTTIFYSC